MNKVDMDIFLQLKQLNVFNCSQHLKMAKIPPSGPNSRSDRYFLDWIPA